MKTDPKTRLAAYIIGAVALLILSVLLARGVIDKQTALSLYDGLELILSLFGVSVVGLAAKVLGTQIKNNTLTFSGTAPEQAIAAYEATVENAATSAQRAVADALDLQRVQDAFAGALKDAAPIGDKVAAAVERLRAK